MRCAVQLLLFTVAIAVSGTDADVYPNKDMFDHLPDDVKSHILNLRDGRGGHGYTGQMDMEPCPVACQYDYRPVCGSDGRTYVNKCELALTACRERRRVFVEKSGECTGIP